MDPNETLKQIRELVAELDLDWHGTNVADLVALVKDLDEWLQTGGFLPDTWAPNLENRYKDFPGDRPDLAVCKDCSTRTYVAAIPRDEIEQHDKWHTDELVAVSREIRKGLHDS